MTPPERPEVAAELHAQNVGRRRITFDNGQHEDVYAVAVDHSSGRWEQIWVLRSSALADRVADALNGAAAAEPLRGALEPFAEFADPSRIVPESHVITQGSPMARRQLTMGDCYRARAALEATAPSTPEPALDVERLAMAIHDSDDRDADPTDRPFCPACLADAQRYADRYRALTSESRAAAPQEGD